MPPVAELALIDVTTVRAARRPPVGRGESLADGRGFAKRTGRRPRATWRRLDVSTRVGRRTCAGCLAAAIREKGPGSAAAAVR